MRRYLIPAVSLAALTMSGMAIAQSTTAPAPEQPAQVQPGSPDCAANPADPACPSTDQTQKTDPGAATTPPATTAQDPAAPAPAENTAQDPAAAPATPDTTTAQDKTAPAVPETTTGTDTTTTTTPSTSTAAVDTSNGFLASSVIGRSVYSSAKENIGDINDLIVGEKGEVKAAIIGVGGFLGMGEKDVAVPLDKLSMTKDENGIEMMTITASREELEAAPAFDRTMVTGSLQ
jgi:sporulation protein YlmC with PRC-barrel domain